MGEAEDWPVELREARAKVQRGVEHLSAFNAAHTAFLESEPYRVVVQFEAEAGCYVARIRVREEPPLRLSAIIGDVVHNFRSALDLIAWQLALMKSKAATRANKTSISFPITQAPTAFKAHSAVCFFTSPAAAVLEGLQPYNAADSHDPRWFLGPLSVLSNADKHRALTASFAALDFTDVAWRPSYLRFEDDSEGFGIEGLLRRGDRFEHGTRVAYLRFGAFRGDPRDFKVDVTRQPTANVLFGSDGFGPNAMVGFMDAANAVFCAVEPLFA